MLRQAIEFTCGIAQEKLVNRGVDSLFESFSGKHNSADSNLENVDSNFNSLMARADDVEKEISIKEEEQGRKRKREVEVWLEDVKKVEGEYRTLVEEEKKKGFMRKIFGGGEAIQLNARICYLDKRSRLFGELVLADDDSTPKGLPRPTTELEGAEFQVNFERIWNLLENEQVSSIGVHGMGGVGKSTLVTHIHNQLLGRNRSVVWVVISSQRCSIKMLQDKIARKLGVDLSDDDEGARAGRLNHALTQRGNFVLILDDVWECIDLVKVGLPLSTQGCKWMMTTRSLKVCQEMNCQKRIVVRPLGEDEGWNLFLKNLGRDATSALGDPQVKEIAKKTVEICDGLPLGIITLAGAMSGVTKIQEWRHALGVLKESAMGHEQMEEKVFPVLQYSFDRLNQNDQRCFLYCSMYPEDHVILVKTLLDNFISEKLVDEKKSRAAQRDEGHSIVTRLVKVSLLESVDDSTEENECVKMHDLVRGMAHKITKGKTMVIAGEKFRYEIPTEEEWTEDLEKVSLMMNDIEKIPDGLSPNCPKLTTLLLQRNPLKRIATSFFSRMCGLRTLDLSETLIRELPDSVSEMANLTSLLLKRCVMLQHVPCVRKLKELRELDLSETSTVYSRTSLELKSARLQVLHLPDHVEAEFVEGGEWLEQFTGRMGHTSDFNKLVASKQDGISYHIVVGGRGHKHKYLECDDDVTRKLIVFAHKETILAADDIQYLEFDSCKGMSKCLLDDLTNPASLQELRVYNSRGIECLLTYEQSKSKSPFQALKEIHLVWLEDFTGVIQKLEIEVDPPPSSVFSCLKRVEISHCNKMKRLGLPLSVFEKLEYISIQECEEIEEIIQVDDDALLVFLPNLIVLSLVGLPSLKSFCDAPVVCSSIVLFTLNNCPGLDVPFLNWGTPDSYDPIFVEVV